MVYLIAVALVVGVCAPAHAYIDPGTGSYILQMSLAGLLAVAYTIKLSWQRLTAYAAKIFGGRTGGGTRGAA